MNKKYFSPTPKKWRLIGDSIMIFSLGMSGYVMGLPITDNAKTWTMFVINAIGVIGKIASNFGGVPITDKQEDSINKTIEGK